MAVGGGAESQVIRLATELKARGWEVGIVSMVTPLGRIDELEKAHIAVHSLDMKAGVPDFRAVFRLRTVIRSFKPDIVHCHMYHANILGRVTRLICKIPTLICTAHNTREESTHGGPTWHKELLYRVTDSLADRTTIICQAGFDRYVRVGAVPRSKLCMIPNGIDTEVFSRSEARRIRSRKALGIGSEFVWIAVGRLVKQKDYPTLFRALAMMERRDFIVLIAGRGPLEREIKEDCARNGLDRCVRFCGVREDVVDLYNAADAFLMSSLFEGLSVALLEAASVGLPSVVTNVGGNSEIVTDNVTGYLVPPASPTQLAAAMQRMMSVSLDDREAIGRAARQHCCGHYAIAAVMDKWLDLYTKTMPAASDEIDQPVAA